MSTKIITSVADIISFAKSETAHNLETWWFRGQSDAQHKLVPGLFRPVNGKFYDENKLIEEFVRMHPEARVKHVDTLELLTYAQHYGLPTRLLDWSENALVALYFACANDADRDGRVFFLPNYIEDLDDFDYYNYNFGKEFTEKLIAYNDADDFDHFFLSLIEGMDSRRKELVLDQIFINGKSLKDYMVVEFPTDRRVFPIGVDIHYGCTDTVVHAGFMYTPKRINRRLITQQGCFTCHTGKVMFGTSYVNTNDFFDRHSRSFIVPKAYKQSIMHELKYCGIYEATLFPELDYQTKHIKSTCLFSRPY
ncbi:FRG domain-containing protein [Vibrio parahaemolyticus]|nr:FRG domain-containing protein [Vibrio parahaemolyticus]